MITNILRNFKKVLIVGFMVMMFPMLTLANPNSYMPLEINNQSAIATDSQVYIFIKGQDAKTSKACVMQFNQNGTGTCVLVTKDMDLSNFNYKLSDFPIDKDNTQYHQLFIPKVISGRIYFSIAKPMVFYVDSSNPNALTIPDPDGFKTRDPNYYTLYDKVEFSYNDAGTWINPTAVDFFSLPIGIYQPSSTTTIKRSGFGKSTRSEILYAVNQTFALAKEKEPSTFANWNDLKLEYQGQMQDGSHGSTLLRLIAPGKAMVAKTQLSNNTPFAVNYLNDQKQFGFSYINALWNYYKSHNIRIDASELKNNPNAPKLKSYIFTGTVNNNDEFVFTNGTDPSANVILTKPKSVSFFAGAVGSFNASNNTPKAIIVRELTSAFEVGLIPIPARNNKTPLLNKAYFEKHKATYYTDNPRLGAGNTGPWYDLYSKALHQIKPEQPIYTFAYDDALDQDGTLHDPNANHIGPIIITLGDMTGTQIPAPIVDSHHYDVTVTLGENANKSYYLTVNGKQVLPGKSLQLSQVKVPLIAYFNGTTYKIYLKHPMIIPYRPITDGIVINTESSPVTLTFPGPPN